MNVRKESGTMNRRLNHTILYSLLIILVFAPLAGAETVSQDITLRPGWNAIFLEVEPGVVNLQDREPTDPENVFVGIQDLQSVWQWNHRASTVEFIQNPDLLVAPDPAMLVYIPGNDPVTNLFAIQGNGAYLVQLGGTVNQTLTITGEPKIPQHKWKPNSFNLVGFHVDDSDAPTSLPSYFDFFASSPAHLDEDTGDPEIYVLDNNTSLWEKVILGSDKMQRGEAFWIYCNGSSVFEGPVSATLELSSGLHFGDKLFEQQLFLNNNSLGEKTFMVTLSALTPAPASNPVRYWVFDEVDEVPSWEEFPASRQFSVAPGDSQKVRLGVRRTGLGADIEYVTNIGVSDGEGVNFLLPLSVTGIDYAGLWTGYVTINKVSDVNKFFGNGTYDDTPQPTGSEFDFRLILHAEDDGTARILSQVIQMWQDGTLKPDPDNLGQFVVDEEGHFVLFTDETLIDSFEGSQLRDGQQIGRRISAPVFPRLTAVQGLLDGSAVSGGSLNPAVGNVLTSDVVLAADDPTNPFVHLFHKIHGIVDGEVVDDHEYEITRTISLTFAEEDEGGKPITGLVSLNQGSSELTGVYQETITGLNKRSIKIEGTFVLHRVSDVATLTQTP